MYVEPAAVAQLVEAGTGQFVATALSETIRGLRAVLRWYQILIGGAKRTTKLAASIQAQAR